MYTEENLIEQSRVAIYFKLPPEGIDFFWKICRRKADGSTWQADLVARPKCTYSSLTLIRTC